jgi:hypothetical protein
MFAGIDVAINWRGQHDCPLEAIRIILQGPAPPDERPGVLAYAFPYEGTRIVVFYDRVEHEVERSRVPALMAHVIAHEITHLLEGTSRHSQTGLMKAHWTNDDYLQMVWKPLPFTPADVILIHRGLEMRSLHLAGK